MSGASNQNGPESIGTLTRRIVADGKTYVRAEIELYKHKALAWVPPVRTAAILAVVALFLAQASITAFLVLFGLWLAFWLGPIGGGLVAALTGLIIAGLLVWIAIKKVSATPPGAKA